MARNYSDPCITEEFRLSASNKHYGGLGSMVSHNHSFGVQFFLYSGESPGKIWMRFEIIIVLPSS
ncbi:hypothetical protein BH18THE2_BH18THE2_22780 [soil metagenome]